MIMQQDEKIKELMRKLDETLGKGELRKCILGSRANDEPETKSFLLQSIGSLINFAAIYIYCTYWQKNPELTEKHTKATKRVVSTLRDIYVKYDLSLELISFVMINTQIAITRSRPKENLCGLIGLPQTLGIIDDDHKTSGLLSLISKGRKNSKSVDIDKNITVDYLQSRYINMLELFSFFSKIAIEYDEKNGLVKILHKGEEIPTNGAIIWDKSGQEYLLLRSVRNVRVSDIKTELRLEYSSFIGQRTKTFICATPLNPDTVNQIDHSPDDFFLKLTKKRLTHLKPELFHKGSNTGSYVNISKLALAIADEIRAEEWKELKNIFANYEDELCIPENFDWDTETSYKEHNIDLDDVILRSLILDSSSELLKTILYADTSDELFPELLENLELRFDEGPYSQKFSAKEIIKTANKRIESLEERLRKVGCGLLDNDYIEDHIRKAASDIRSRIIVRALISSGSELKYEEDPLFAGNIYSKISFLKEMLNNIDGKTIDRVAYRKHTQHVFGQVLRMMISFYNGLISCAELRAEYEIESMGPGGKGLDTAQKRIENKFLSAVKTYSEKLKNASLSDLIKELVELNRSPSKSKDVLRSFQIMTGKNEIFDNDALFKSISENDAGYGFYHDDRFVMFEDQTENHKTIKKLIDVVRDVLKLFGGIKNDDRDTDLLLRNAAYPFEATYSYKRVNKDDQKMTDFILVIKDSFHDESIHIITEFDYQSNDKYYMLPNILKVNGYWLHDPFMINCSEFDKFFMTD